MIQRNGEGVLVFNPSSMWQVLTLIGALSVGGGAGGTAIYQLIQPPRPDPFTGMDGRKLEEKFDKQRIELRNDLVAHTEYDTRRFERLDVEGTRALQRCNDRVSALEQSKDSIMHKLERIETTLIEVRVALGLGNNYQRQFPPGTGTTAKP